MKMTTKDIRKRCTKCKQNKIITDFYVDKSRKDGRHPRCRACRLIETTAKRRASGMLSLQDIHKRLSSRTSRVCNRCNVDKLLSEYGLAKKSPDGHKYTCRDCEREIGLKRYREGKIDWKKHNQTRKEKRRKLKFDMLMFIGGECVECHLKVESLPVVCFDFHHKDGGAKEKEISKMIYSGRYSVEEVKREVKKCSVMCAICHRIETFIKGE